MGARTREPRRDLFDSPNKQRCVSRTSATRCRPRRPGSSREMRTGLARRRPPRASPPPPRARPDPPRRSRRRTSEIASVIDHSNSPTFSTRSSARRRRSWTSRRAGLAPAPNLGPQAVRGERIAPDARDARRNAPPTSEFTAAGILPRVRDPGDPPAALPTPPGRASDDPDAARDAEPRLAPLGADGWAVAPAFPPWRRLRPAREHPRRRVGAPTRRARGGASGRRGSRRRRLRRRRGGGVSPRRLLPRTRSRRRRRRRRRRRSRRRGGRHHRRSRPRARGARGGATKGGSRARVPLRRRRQARIGGGVARARRRATRG